MGNRVNKFRDRLFGQSGRGVRAAAFGVLSRASKNPAELTAALALLLLIICKKYKVRMPEVMGMAARLYNEGEGAVWDKTNHHAALIAYIVHELPDVS